LILQPKLRADALRRLQAMSRIGSVELKLGGLNYLNLSSNQPAVARLLEDARNEFNAVAVQVSFSTDRAGKLSLRKRAVDRFIRFFSRPDSGVVSLTARGNREDEPSEVVDFIRDRLAHSGEVEYSGKHLDRGQCRRLLKNAVVLNQNYLKTLL
jgi:hypothetical protein